MTTTDYGACVTCGMARRWYDVLEQNDDGTCGPCFVTAFLSWLDRDLGDDGPVDVFDVPVAPTCAHERAYTMAVAERYTGRPMVLVRCPDCQAWDLVADAEYTSASDALRKRGAAPASAAVA